RDRVAGLLEPSAREAFLAKCVKIPHPWPALPATSAAPHALPRQDGRVHVAYIGRLEYRKGVDLLVRAADEALDRLDRPVTFHFFGRDTGTWHGESMRGHLDTLIGKEHAASFEFHDYVPQNELRERYLPAMDLFVFPSRFENYPNVLLEVLGLGKPVLVSQFGCMPEMGAEFEGVTAFDPHAQEAFSTLLHESLRELPRQVDGPAKYEEVAAAMNAELVARYQRLIASPPRKAKPRAKKKQPTIAFVVPHFNHSALLPQLLSTVLPQMEKGDELILVDDCSNPIHEGAARTAIEEVGGTFISTGRNSGPSRARNIGARHARTDLVYFVDADDELVPDTVQVFRRAFMEHPDLDVASGFMRVFGDQNHYWASYDPIPATILQENSSHAGIVMRRSAFVKCGGYSDQLRLHFEDWEFHARLTLAGYRFEIIPVVTYRYRVNLKTGRNSSRREMILFSYQNVVHSALSNMPANRLPAVWPDLQQMMVGLLKRKEELEQYAARPHELRYRLADSLNDMVKRSGVHKPLKGLMKRALSLRRG
ncbi:MAG: glycosyltransferase, partial [Myxococcales bacterium]